jgi:glycosyltransferase involved in cell wall biosynthesis
MKIWMACETLTEGVAPNVTVLEIRSNLKKQNHQVLLFCPSTEKKYAGPEDYDMYFVPTIKVRWLKEISYQLFLALSMLSRSLRSRPDWVYSRPVLTMISPVLVSKIIRRPHILHLAGDTVELLRTLNSSLSLRVLYEMLEKINFKLSSRVVVTTWNNKVNHQKRHYVPDERIVVIPNGANVELFRPMDIQEAREQLGVEKDCFCVGFTGNLTFYQGLPYLIESAPMILEELPHTVFLIVGDGEVKNKLVELAEKAGIADKFIFTGRVPYQSVPVYIAASDVCVAPRIRAMCEKTGISLLKIGEYLACERPMVASDIEGVGPVLRKANAGIPIPPEDPRELAQAIIKLLKDKALREEMGKNGRKFVLENLSWEVSTRKLLEAYESAVAKGGRDSSLRN